MGDDELPSYTDAHWRSLGTQLAVPQASHAHATALVAAYSFALGHHGRHSCLVPFFDALNHAPPELASVRLSHDAAAGELSMVMRLPVKEGAQVWNSYGPLGTCELIRRYGFAPPPCSNGRHDCGEVAAAELVHAAAAAGVPGSLIASGVRMASKTGLLRRGVRFAVKAATGAPSPQLLATLRLLCGGASAAAIRLNSRRAPSLEAAGTPLAAALAILAVSAQKRLGGSMASAQRAVSEARAAGQGAAVLAHSARAMEHAAFQGLAMYADSDACGRASYGEQLLYRRLIRSELRHRLLRRRMVHPRSFPNLSLPGVVASLGAAGALRLGQRTPRSACCDDEACNGCPRLPFQLPARLAAN